MSILSDSFEIRKLIAKRIDEHKIDISKLCELSNIDVNTFMLYVYQSTPNRVPSDDSIFAILSMLGIQAKVTIVVASDYKPIKEIQRWAS